jgi:hypothetical protein
MAQTFKYGNGIWANKKGSSLAYNDEDGNYKPLPFNFERSSSATRTNKEGLIETVGANEPRIDYKDNTKGALLLEPQSTNYLTYSEDFSQSYWSKSNSSFSDYSGLSPQGTYNAKTITDSGAGGVSTVHFNRYSLGGALPSDGDYTYSIFAKKGSRKLLRFRVGVLNGISDAVADFNLDTGVVFSTSGTPFNSTLIEPYKDGWYRISVSLSITNLLSSQFVRIRMLSDNGSTSLNLDGTNTMHFFGAQVEKQSSATSYIPTLGATSTRSLDNPNSTVDLSSFLNSYPFSMYVHSKYVGGNRFALAFSNTSVDNQYYTISVVDDEVRLDARANGTSERLQSGTTLNEGDEFKVSIVMESDTIGKICVNGGSVLYKNNFSLQSINSSIKYLIMGKLRIVSDTGDRLPVFAARLYDEALSDAEMVKLTTL